MITGCGGGGSAGTGGGGSILPVGAPLPGATATAVGTTPASPGAHPTSNPSAVPSATASASPTAAPTGTPASAPTGSAAAIVAGPSGVNTAIGGNVQVGILDPGKFPIAVSGTNGLAPSGFLETISNVVGGIVEPNAAGLISLDLNGVTNGTTLQSVVGANGSTLNLCQLGSTTDCTTIALTSQPAGISLASSLASIALQPGQSEPLTVSALPGASAGGPFTAISSNLGVTVIPTGSGTFTVSASTLDGVPTNATITVTDAHGNEITIPVTVF